MDRALAFAIEHAVTLMLITCPHARGLAVPLVVAVATVLDASHELLIRNRVVFESARKLQAVHFDKTGTLTAGRVGVSDNLMLAQDIGEATLRCNTADVGAHAEHSIAEVFAATPEAKLNVENFKRIPAKAPRVRAVDGRIETLPAQGKAVVFILIDGPLKGATAQADTVQPEAKQAIEALKALNIRCQMPTGDNQVTAKWLSGQIGLNEYSAEVLPQDKAVKGKAVQARGVLVAITGEGVNDLPVLAQAHVGIAFGAGPDVVAQTADTGQLRSNPLDTVATMHCRTPRTPSRPSTCSAPLGATSLPFRSLRAHGRRGACYSRPPWLPR